MKTYNHDWLIAEWERMGRPEVEILTGLNKEIWIPCADENLFKPDRQYRIKCKPWINWEHVHPSIVAIATDKDGQSYLYSSIPRSGTCVWHTKYECPIVDIFASFTPGTCDWKDSLVMRPVVVGEEK